MTGDPHVGAVSIQGAGDRHRHFHGRLPRVSGHLGVAEVGIRYVFALRWLFAVNSLLANSSASQSMNTRTFVLKCRFG